jgi:hypothetical protein
MDSRQKQVYDEAAALWREVYGDRPPPRADGATLLEMITRGCPDIPYDRLRSPHLRPSTIAGPAQPRREARSV